MELRERAKLIKAITIAYEDSITTLSAMDNSENALRFLLLKRMTRGICFYSTTVLGKSIFKQEWVKRNNAPKSNYWCAPVESANTIDEMIALLKFRVKILKQEYKRIPFIFKLFL